MMMFRRRPDRPPFAVMKGRVGPAVPLSNKPGSTAEGDGAPREGWGRWQQPVVLRLPPGYAVLIVVGLVVLLMIAFGAGYSQGSSRTEARWQAKLADEQGVAQRLGGGSGQTAGGGQSGGGQSPGGRGVAGAAGATGGGMGGQGSAGALPTASSGVGVYDDPTLDPRKPGYQYYIVAHCSKEEAQRLVDFFAERRVDAAAVISHNRTSQYAVFVLTPITREQISSPESRELKRRIAEMGKVWHSRAYRGPTNLSDTYLALYKGKAD